MADIAILDGKKRPRVGKVVGRVITPTDRKTYWENRAIQLFNAQDSRNHKFEKKVQKEYIRVEEQLKKEIASYYAKYGEKDVLQYRKMVQNLTEKERDLLYRDYDEFARRNPKYKHLMPVRESIYNLNRLEGLQLNVRMRIVELGAFEQEGLEKLLQEAYEKGYLSSMEGLQNAPSFFSINNLAMQQTINATWTQAANFSDRIWKNKNDLINAINNEIRDGLIRGADYRQMTKALQERTGVGEFSARRLVRTESAFVMNQANKQAFIDAGIKRYEISAVMDRRTSNVCRRLDGEVFDFKNASAGVNYPPFHPMCRSTALPVEE